MSTRGDIFSYGILVLEMVTGKRPADSKFIQGQSLRKDAELGLHGKVLDDTDPRLSSCLETTDNLSHKEKVDNLISLLRHGVSFRIRISISI
jgi:receptor kinase-like protein